MKLLSDIGDALSHLVFPRICDGCGNDLLNGCNRLCMRCLEALPQTHFESYPGNPVERRFYGRLQVVNATAQYYFTKESLMAHLVHQVKYKRNKELGLQLGLMMGDALKKCSRFNADILVPLPLFPARERKRGFNQSVLLCEGIASILNIPMVKDIIIRPLHTETQTTRGRIERWKNIEGKFLLRDADSITGKHLLLVDDVITTGATLESCGSELLKAKNCSISIACLCHSFQ